LEHILGILGIGRSRFFELLKTFRENPDDFSIDYKREGLCRRISSDIERNIGNGLDIQTISLHIMTKKIVLGKNGKNKPEIIWEKPWGYAYLTPYEYYQQWLLNHRDNVSLTY